MKKELCFVLGVIAGSTSVSATTTAPDSTAVVCDTTFSITKINIVEDDDFDEKNKVKDAENESLFESLFATEGTSDLNRETRREKRVKVYPTPEYKKTNDEEKIFTAVEQKAIYPGGEAELLKWVGENIEYPKSACEEGVQGRIVVQFVIDKDGSIGEVKVVRGKHPDLDKEAMRVIKTIPEKFTPAKQNGQIVRSWFTLPVMFRLQQ